MKTVVVGMSGGVDSSLSAALLLEQGFRVIGLFMKNWEEQDAAGVCSAQKDYEDALKTADFLKIPFYTINFAEEYRSRVFSSFLADLERGLTPNPDILCNREIKFDVFWEKAKTLSADFLATGHYCRLDEKGHLLKGLDPDKDQSYFLHAVSPKAFQNVLFPVGHLKKQQVRELARHYGLPTAQKKDSTGICFIGKRDFKPFVAKYLGYHPGAFQTLDGTVVGKHDGSAFYTIGQRKGLRLGGEGDAWFVVAKDTAKNIVYVERGADHPALFSSGLLASHFSWQTDEKPLRCTAKIRYRQQDQECHLEWIDQDTAHVFFACPQRAITPGQSVVFYEKDRCLGGAVIQEALAPDRLPELSFLP